MMPSSFFKVVIRFRSSLEKAFGECCIDALEEEHRCFRDRNLRVSLTQRHAGFDEGQGFAVHRVIR
jgi:hypothetical protein